MRQTMVKTALVKAVSLLILMTGGLLLAACGQADAANLERIAGGNPERGKVVLQSYGCTTCHTIPGIRGANALVGPPLTAWAERHYIAGTLPNNPINLRRWLINPQEIEPGTAMPDLNVTEPDARDMAAYLYTLNR